MPGLVEREFEYYKAASRGIKAESHWTRAVGERSAVSEKWPDKRRLQFLKDRAAHYSRQPSRFPGVTTSRRPSLCDASFVRMCPAFVPILWIDTFPVFFTKVET